MKKTKVIQLFRENGAFGFRIIEIDQDALKKSKSSESVEPDIFPIFIANLTKKAREFFEI